MMKAEIVHGPPPRVDAEVEVLVIGAGAAGLTAALRAAAGGAEVLAVERDAAPTGSTALSSGFIPAPGTRFQRAIGVQDDGPRRLFADLMSKSGGRSDPNLARLATESIGPAMEWLADQARLDWVVLDDFLYPGHSRHRMHAAPERTGAGLMTRLLTAANGAEIPIATEARAETLYMEGDRVAAVGLARGAAGAEEVIAARTVILASSGYAGAPDLVAETIPEMAGALYFGHPGNEGHALRWGRALGADLGDLSGYQGHGSVAHPHGALITWALIMEGGVQVNAAGARFSDESRGYSEQAVSVLEQPGGVAWTVFDERLHEFAMAGFADYRAAAEAGAAIAAPTAAALAEKIGAPPDVLERTLAAAAAQPSPDADAFGRDFRKTTPLSPPFRAVRVTGALFHSQGGLKIGPDGRVLKTGGGAFPNILACGGAACGVSGPRVDGYLSGAGLLTAIAFGWVAGGAVA